MSFAFISGFGVRNTFLLLSFCFLIQGCAQKEPPAEKTFCPSITLIGDLSRTTIQTPEGPASIAITQSRIHCSPDDPSSPPTVSLRLQAQKSVIPGAKETVTVPLFVALVDSEGKILAKEILETTLIFEKGQAKARVLMTEILSFPIGSSQDVLLVTGLQSPEALHRHSPVRSSTVSHPRLPRKLPIISH